jgi:hypothetical protein
LPGKFVDKLVKGITVPYSRETVNVGIGTDDEKVGIEESRGITGPNKHPVSQEHIKDGTAPEGGDKNEKQGKLTFYVFLEKEYVHQGNHHGTATEDEPDKIPIAVENDVVRFGDVKVKMPPKIYQQNEGVEGHHDQDNFLNLPGPFLGFKSQIIHKDKDVKKTDCLE